MDTSPKAYRMWPIMILIGGMLEEPGWTGYALPQLLDRFKALRYGTLIATLLMAAIRIGWHVPLMLNGHVSWVDIPLMLTAQFVIVWLFNRTGGSVLAIMLLHLMNNTFSGEFVNQFFTGADAARHAWLLAGVWSLLAIGVLVLAGARLGADQARRVMSSWRRLYSEPTPDVPGPDRAALAERRLHLSAFHLDHPGEHSVPWPHGHPVDCALLSARQRAWLFDA